MAIDMFKAEIQNQRVFKKSKSQWSLRYMTVLI